MIYLGVLALLLLAGLVGSRLDAKDWNGGRCKKHGYPWRSFDMDSQGGRGYKCFNGSRVLGSCTTWQSYGHDRDYIVERT